MDSFIIFQDARTTWLGFIKEAAKAASSNDANHLSISSVHQRVETRVTDRPDWLEKMDKNEPVNQVLRLAQSILRAETSLALMEIPLTLEAHHHMNESVKKGEKFFEKKIPEFGAHGLAMMSDYDLPKMIGELASGKTTFGLPGLHGIDGGQKDTDRVNVESAGFKPQVVEGRVRMILLKDTHFPDSGIRGVIETKNEGSVGFHASGEPAKYLQRGGVGLDVVLLGRKDESGFNVLATKAPLKEISKTPNGVER